MNRLGDLLRRPIADWWLLFQIGIMLLIFRLGLALLPFRRMRRILKDTSQFRGAVPADDDEKQRILWAVRNMSRYVVSDRPCLTQALAVQWLLARRGHATDLRIGVAKEKPEKLLAHAWVEHNGQVLIGGRHSPTKFTPLPSLEELP